ISRLLIKPTTLYPRIPQELTGNETNRFKRSRDVNTLLIVNVIVSLLAMNFGLVLTTTVNLSYGGDATTVGAVHTLNAVGALAGGIFAARKRKVSVHSLIPATAV